MDPLAQLSDIHLPSNVHNYPIAPGWWLLAILALALIIYTVVKLRQYFIKRKVQKIALKQLTTATEISSIVAMLKWAALQYFPREKVAHLTGDAFKTFLITTLPTKQQDKFSELSAEHFNSVYQSDSASQKTDDFSAAAKLWLSYALPPKKDLPVLASAITKNSSASLDNSKEIEDISVEDIVKNEGVKS
ncbi:DUF4381 domain-containing protein [Cognaticolwellia beringensis]|uniref:DUF4381 domain-containing protein n=1 Tax=Cognaticolwellia beringensis TaxID=1967665 RepID=A0A222G410_9GAMM|nr:DUF4381 domain-containing protein [Cognaticolwellia beringensis]ASP46666.1 DUF4381 domain-containing protein [Cognaticolwellia beringensis]